MGRIRVLIVSQDPPWVDAVVQALAGAVRGGVEATSTTADAVGRTRHGEIDCVVVDERFDSGTGTAVVPILLASNPALRVVFAGRPGGPEVEARARAMPIFYYHAAADGPEDLVAAVTAAVGPSPRGTSGNRSILIVDDDSAFASAFRLVLEAASYRVHVAGSTAQGLAMAREAAPDLILVDIMMESPTDGLEFCHEARRDPLLRHRPIVVVSSFPRAEAAAVFAAGGEASPPVDGYVEKPVEPADLLAAVREALGEE